MNLKEYIKSASNTAIYPNKDSFWGYDYCFTALIGEVGEVYNKLKKCIRSDNWNLTKEKKKQLSEECGGCIWYCSQIFRELGTETQHFEKDVDKLSNEVYYEFKGSWEDSFDNQILKLKLIMNRCMRLINGLIGIEEGVINNPPNKFTHETTDKISIDVFNIYLYLCVFIKELDLKVSEVMQSNLDILRDRAERNVIEGEGDNR